MTWFITDNRSRAIPLQEIPCLPYARFSEALAEMLTNPGCHCGSYFAVANQENDCGKNDSHDEITLYGLILNDTTHQIYLSSAQCQEGDELPSLANRFPQLNNFEREIQEEYDLEFTGSPWDKPLRYAEQRIDPLSNLNNYPFYTIAGETLHEVNVGPIHAGIIEPGVFRFICDGEQVLNLEIVLGFQHRGVESLIPATDNRLRQVALCESTCGDSSVSYAATYTYLIEKLTDRKPNEILDQQRLVALELERVATHIGDTAALCTDIAYQLGQVACEALRTMTINTTQTWCGNRFGKALVRPGGTDYPFSKTTVDTLLKNLSEVENRYTEICENLASTPSILSRFEDMGVVTLAQMQEIGAVGLAAKCAGLSRDIRSSHPYGAYGEPSTHTPCIETSGDVMARFQLRAHEVTQSVQTLREILIRQSEIGTFPKLPAPDYTTPFSPSALAFSVVEGWRGEICHVALTDPQGKICRYKLKDPSFHNWNALTLAVRGAEISEFPVYNKSFNLSYAGFDL